MAHERKAYSISYQISTHKQVFVTLSSCIGLKRNIGGSVLRAVLQNCHFRVASLAMATLGTVTGSRKSSLCQKNVYKLSKLTF